MLTKKSARRTAIFVLVWWVSKYFGPRPYKILTRFCLQCIYICICLLCMLTADIDKQHQVSVEIRHTSLMINKLIFLSENMTDKHINWTRDGHGSKFLNNPTQPKQAEQVGPYSATLSNSFMSVISTSHRRTECMLILSNGEPIMSSKVLQSPHS